MPGLDFCRVVPAGARRLGIAGSTVGNTWATLGRQPLTRIEPQIHPEEREAPPIRSMMTKLS